MRGRSLATGNLGDVVWHEERIGPRRLIAGGSPARVGLDRFAPEKLDRLGARLIPQCLALQVGGNRQNLQPAGLGFGNALCGVDFGPGIVAAAGQIEFPSGFFPAVEAGLGDPIEPGVLRHVAELSADEPDLMVRVLAAPMRFRLLVTHPRCS